MTEIVSLAVTLIIGAVLYEYLKPKEEHNHYNDVDEEA